MLDFAARALGQASLLAAEVDTAGSMRLASRPRPRGPPLPAGGPLLRHAWPLPQARRVCVRLRGQPSGAGGGLQRQVLSKMPTPSVSPPGPADALACKQLPTSHACKHAIPPPLKCLSSPVVLASGPDKLGDRLKQLEGPSVSTARGCNSTHTWPLKLLQSVSN